MYKLTAIAIILSASSAFALDTRDPQNGWDAFVETSSDLGGAKKAHEEHEPVQNAVGTPESSLTFNINNSKGTSFSYTLTTKSDDSAIEFSYTNNANGEESGGMNAQEASAWHMENVD